MQSATISGHARDGATRIDEQPPDTNEQAFELLAELKAGNQTAWNKVVEQYSGLVWAIARAHGLGPSEAADVSQVTWLRLLQHLDSVRQPNRLGSWLATTARRESLRVCRLRRREVPITETSKLERGHTEDEASDAALLANERNFELWQAFQLLPGQCQRLLRLLMASPPPSYAEVASALDMPIGSIGPIRGRCLQCLRRTMVARGAI